MGKKNADIDSIMDDINEKERRDAAANAPQQDYTPNTASEPYGHQPSEAAEKEPNAEGIIPFGHFAAIDLRVGRILEVEDVPGARKPLYKLKVDVGELGMRQLVAGIKAFYTKEELIGRQIVIVANLEPRKIAGILSHGMLLAAENGNDVSLLSPDREFRAGSKIG
jgi:methionine--tRNA ligase beta chain